MYKPVLKYICVFISLIMFVNYLPAQSIEANLVDSMTNTQTSVIEIDTTEQSDNNEKIEAVNDSTGKIDTVGQKISDKEKKELRKEKKKALIGLAVIACIVTGIFIAAWVTSLGGINDPS